MNPEPLDGMVVTLKDIRYHYNLGLVDLDDRFFPYEDVKSAVEGFKDELRDKKITLELSDEQYDAIFRMIDKWFKDVIE